MAVLSQSCRQQTSSGICHLENHLCLYQTDEEGGDWENFLGCAIERVVIVMSIVIVFLLLFNLLFFLNIWTIDLNLWNMIYKDKKD